jgi:hypothetical protein
MSVIQLCNLALSQISHRYSCNVQPRAQAVWKIFWIMPRGAWSAADSKLATSSLLRRQPIAPRFSSACFKLFTPGIGIAPLHTHQLIATFTKQMHRLWSQNCVDYPHSQRILRLKMSMTKTRQAFYCSLLQMGSSRCSIPVRRSCLFSLQSV